MKTALISIIFLAFLFLNCTVADDCPEGINQLPMYGKIKKCKQQIESDSLFIKDCDKNFNGDRKQAAKYFVSRGWQYFYKNKLDTAMFRFNQAWLLDSLNADTYWGFGNIEGIKKKYYQSLPLFEHSIRLNPNNSIVYECISSSCEQIYEQTKSITYMDLSVKYLKIAAKLTPKNPRIYAELTTAYIHFLQKDSARKYLKITDRLAPNLINPQVRTIITNQ